MHTSTIGKPQRVGSTGPNPLLKIQKTIQPDRLDRFLLAQVAWCTVPAMLLIRMGQLQAGSLWCLMFLVAFLSRYGLKRNVPAFVALTVGSLPVLSYTRLLFLYSSVLVFLALGLAFWFVRSPKECSKFWDNSLIRLFFIVGTVYWVVSVLITKIYYSNISVMEMLCSAGSIYLLARHPRYLATALTGITISIVSITVGLIGLGERLGMADIAGQSLGNPYLLGHATALILLLALADNGKWLFLQNSHIQKNSLIATCALILLLSTNRGSWLIALVGLTVTLFYQSQHRKKVFMGMLLMGCVLVGVMQTKSGERIYEYFEMATDSERTLSEKTTGRSQQWQLFPKVLKDSPIWGVGPGLGVETYAKYSWEDREVTHKEGERLAWHAIYLHVGVETGMIGLTILFVFLITLILRGLLYRQATGNIIPLIGILGFMTLGISSPGTYGISGLFLGLAFIGTTLPPKEINKKSPISPQISKLKGISSSLS